MATFITLIIFINNVVEIIEAEISVGDSCVVYKDGSNGVCSYISDCHISNDPEKVLSNTGVCFYPRRISGIPVVCCPARYTSPFVSNQRPAGAGGNQYQNENQRPTGIEFPTENYYEVGNQRPTGNEYPTENPYHRPSNGNPYNTGNQYQTGNQYPGNQAVNQRPSTGNVYNTGNQYQTQRPTTSGYNNGNQQQNGNRRTSTTRQQGYHRPNNYPETTTQISDPIIFPTENSNQYHRKSAQKCAEYSRLVTNFIAPLPLLPNPEPTSVAIPKCNFDAISLIVGGTKAKAKEFPHMAALGYIVDGDVAWQCGGTLISEDFVLTAAHCTHSRDRGPPVKVRLGDLNLESDSDGARPETLDIIDIIKHPRYSPPAKYNDIALIRLSRPIQFNDYIRPACLWNSNYINYTRTIATGWGQVGFADDPSPHLLKVGLDIIDNNQCQQYYQGDDRILPRGIVSSMICSGVLSGGKDTCLGDSGGPIVVSNQKNHCLFYVIGVTSFGKACALVNSPGVYTRVSSYIEWIESHVWN
ncbi:serine protease snake-like [Chrysoperla carnea]|uniref:serine protease snake-like n=1 Tax=Chrysoperla carnea TaxID=189513 RepID=UPI001D07406E|nr:serine protease snake-like [Chrysoperla carnea]